MKTCVKNAPHIFAKLKCVKTFVGCIREQCPKKEPRDEEEEDEEVETDDEPDFD